MKLSLTQLVQRLAERARRQGRPSHLWMTMDAAVSLRPDLAGLACVDCGAAADWVMANDGAITGLCQGHIGAHVP